MEQRRSKSTIRSPGTNGKILNRWLLIALDLWTVGVIVACVALTFAALVTASYNENGLMLEFDTFNEYETELTLLALTIPLVVWRVPTWFIRSTMRSIEKEESKWK